MIVESPNITGRIDALTWNDFTKWLHTRSETPLEYVIKVILALTIYVVISEALGRIVKAIQNALSRVNFSQKLIHILLNIIMYSIQIFIIIVSVIQLYLVEYNNIALFIVLAIVAIMLGFKLKSFRFSRFLDSMGFESEIFSFEGANKAFDYVASIIYRIASVAFVIMIIIAIRFGINYVTGSGGEDITSYIKSPDYVIERKLGTSFYENDSIKGTIPEYSSGVLSVRSDDDLNIIYIDGVQVGVNTTSRRYSFYGVEVNQPEIKAVREMYYSYDEMTQAAKDIAGGNSNTYFYYNNERNDCLVLTVSSSSNRVVGITYYTDFEKISKTLF